MFWQWREVLGAHVSGHCVKHQNPILCAVPQVSQNLYSESLNPFKIFLARKYASFGHSAYCGNIYINLSHLRAKYGKSPPNILFIFISRQLKFSLNVLIWSIYLSILETTRWYLSNDMHFVLVYCCVGMLMTSCFGCATPTLGRKRITHPQPKAWRFKHNTNSCINIFYRASEVNSRTIDQHRYLHPPWQIL